MDPASTPTGNASHTNSARAATSNGAAPESGHAAPITIRDLRRMAKQSTPFAALTCYDATMARWLERAGIHVLLVGDTAAEMVLGFKRTIDMPLSVLIALTAGVKRGAPRTVVMADMPFMSYQADDAEAIRNAGRFMTEGMADIVKLEVDASFEKLVEKLTRAGVPVCAHVGSKPQQAALSGGYGKAGKTEAEAEQVVRDAIAMERAGAVMLLIEAVPESVTRRVLESTSVPVIGIGAGNATHGQVLVLQDLLGLSDRPPTFAPAMAQMGEEVRRAATAWREAVAARRVNLPTA